MAVPPAGHLNLDSNVLNAKIDFAFRRTLAQKLWHVPLRTRPL